MVFALLCVLAGALLLNGCTKKEKSGRQPEAYTERSDDRICVVTTIFPYYDFVRQVGGDRVKLKLVVPAGMDSHSFEPTPADMIAMQEADILICNGGGMEQWVAQVLESLDTSSMKVITMMDHVDAVAEEHVEGMEDADHDHAGHSHADHLHPGQQTFDDNDGHAMDIEYDEHIWTSPVNAIKIVGVISEALSEESPKDSARFEANAASYISELEQLDREFCQVVEGGERRMFIVADKFPFRYFADEYGLTYRAAFSGCSTDTEPSAKTIAYLIDKVKETGLPAVYYLELSSHRTAEIIEEETGAVPLLLHSCHNVTRRQFDEGVTYLQLMKGNVENLRRGLSAAVQ